MSTSIKFAAPSRVETLVLLVIAISVFVTLASVVSECQRDNEQGAATARTYQDSYLQL